MFPQTRVKGWTIRPRIAYAKRTAPILTKSLKVWQLCQLTAYLDEHGHLLQVVAIPSIKGFQER